MDGWELDADRLEEYNNYAARVYLCIFVAVFLVCVPVGICVREMVCLRERERECVRFNAYVDTYTLCIFVRVLYTIIPSRRLP